MDTHPKVQPLKTGLVNLPGATPESTALVEKLVLKDVTEHHCFWTDGHFHNHLSHHILSLHDLGASVECIQKMYNFTAAIQRPLYANGVPPAPAEANRINGGNWTNYFGEANSHMYPDYLAFFSAEIATHGVPGALERYVFSPEANGNGTMMLARFVSGLVHPMIQAGFGIEFGQDAYLAEGLTQAALTTPECAVVVDGASGFPDVKSGASKATLLSLMREGGIRLPAPPPDPQRIERFTIEEFMNWSASVPKLGPTFDEIFAKWTFTLSADTAANDKEITSKVEECMWLATLLLGWNAKPGKKPRVDFVIMHFVTASLLMRAVLDVVREPLHKAQLLQMFARSMALHVLLRGRPRIDPALVMSYPAYPAPSKSKTTVSGTPAYGSAWLAVLNNACVHTEAHVIKAIRALFYCAQHYGSTPAGAVIGAVDENGQETHKNAAMLDGTMFIRVAGVLSDAVGWVAHGEEEVFWDFGGGWEEAWEEA
ncbi:hypothetical protein C8R45DRAFT_1159993 [Mycena sanguinolenta]|nr:hypothetical protein C8R45DRAFT_1159993 [Mycena sanguinolenta]